LRALKQNNWFKHAIKIAIAIGSDADKTVLAEFTGTSESVITVKDKHTLKALIRKVSVRASEFQSHSKQSGDTLRLHRMQWARFSRIRPKVAQLPAQALLMSR